MVLCDDLSRMVKRGSIVYRQSSIFSQCSLSAAAVAIIILISASVTCPRTTSTTGYGG